MMRALKSFGAFWYDFVIGDDWQVAARAPLARVPENTMKFAVGVMLTSFGTFWGAEGAGVAWPGGDAALLVLIPVIALACLGYTALLRRGRAAAGPPPATVPVTSKEATR